MRDQMPETTEHVLRAQLPWRTELQLTECGLSAAGSLAVITADRLHEVIKRIGVERARWQTCITCWQTASRHRVDWNQDPVKVMCREAEWARAYGPGQIRNHPAAELFRNELYAIAELVRRYPDEFAGIRDGLTEIPRIDNTTRARRTKRTA
jgi:hypothetical protein